MTFDDVSDLVGGLPESAYRYPWWWANGDQTHSQSKSWGAAGFDAHADLKQRTVTFLRR